MLWLGHPIHIILKSDLLHTYIMGFCTFYCGCGWWLKGGNPTLILLLLGLTVTEAVGDSLGF